MNYSIEVMRLLAVVLITFTHTRHGVENTSLDFLLEQVPKYGTLLLSIISGFLFWTKSRLEPQLFEKKLRSLVGPYLIANGLVLTLVLGIYLLFGFNYLNRLPLDYHLITEGLFSLNGPPIDPPTYFIRDIFVVFVLMDVVFNKRFKLLLLLIPLIFFGKLMLRYDILGLFVLGMILAAGHEKWGNVRFPIFFAVCTVVGFLFFPEYAKYAVAPLLFSILIQIRIPFKKTGGYTYLLHLYHSPTMVLTYPFLSKVIHNDVLCVFAQIGTALITAWVLFKMTERWKRLKVLSGGR